MNQQYPPNQKFDQYGRPVPPSWPGQPLQRAPPGAGAAPMAQSPSQPSPPWLQPQRPQQPFQQPAPSGRPTYQPQQQYQAVPGSNYPQPQQMMPPGVPQQQQQMPPGAYPPGFNPMAAANDKKVMPSVKKKRVLYALLVMLAITGVATIISGIYFYINYVR